jgi:hypothetical protein
MPPLLRSLRAGAGAAVAGARVVAAAVAGAAARCMWT